MNVRWPFTTCRRYREKLTLLAANALSSEDLAPVQAHLESCPACRARLAELRSVTTAISLHANNLPAVEPTLSLRRRWKAGLGEASQDSLTQGSGLLAQWCTRGRLAWGGLAVIWALIICFRFSAPQAPEPAAIAAVPGSLRQALMVLKVDKPGSSSRENGKPGEEQETPEAVPPHSQGRGAKSSFESA